MFGNVSRNGKAAGSGKLALGSKAIAEGSQLLIQPLDKLCFR